MSLWTKSKKFKPAWGRTEPRHWVKYGFFILVSVVIHSAVVGRFKVSTKVLKPMVASVPVKIRIAEAKPTQMGRAPQTRAQSPKPHLTKKRAPHAASKTRAAPITRYDQLFPKLGIDYQMAESDAPAPSQNGSGIQGYDPEDNIPFSARVRHLGKLTEFARDVAEVAIVPPALRQIAPSGTARLRLNRKGNGTWQVTEATGDPYFRALLFETLNSLSPNTYGLVMLSASDFDSVRVVFDYRTVSVVDQTTKPVEVRVDGNKIYIVVTHPEVNPNWDMLAVSPSGTPAVNLLGIGMVLARPYIEKDPTTDIEVKKLRLSPAFARPIGR